METRTVDAVASRIQHCLLRPDETDGQVNRLIDEALTYSFQAVVVHPMWIDHTVSRLANSNVRVCSYADFPIGANASADVVNAVGRMRTQGADEVDILAKIGWLRSGMLEALEEHYANVVAAAEGMAVKVILEVGLLSDQEFAEMVETCARSGVDYIKNATGYERGECTPALTAKMSSLARGRLKVKASGEVYTAEDAFAHIDAGADLFGITLGVPLIQDTIAKVQADRL